MRKSLPFFALFAVLGIGVFFAIKPGIGRAGHSRPGPYVKADINGGIKSALGAFEVDNGHYPKNLEDLVQKPADAKNWRGPYLEKLPIDPWGNRYIYEFPGKHNTNGYDLMSAGPDGKAGTADDIGNWMN